MKKDLFYEVFDEFNKKWALVSSGSLNDFACMTIAWGSIGVLWRKPIITIYIKPIRNTYDYLIKNDRFTVSFFGDEYKKDLVKLGTVSGRNEPGKIELTDLTPYSLSDTIAYKEAKTTFVCKKIYAQQLDSESIPRDVNAEYYLTEAAHMVFIGEIEEIIDR